MLLCVHAQPSRWFRKTRTMTCECMAQNAAAAAAVSNLRSKHQAGCLQRRRLSPSQLESCTLHDYVLSTCVPTNPVALLILSSLYYPQLPDVPGSIHHR